MSQNKRPLEILEDESNKKLKSVGENPVFPVQHIHVTRDGEHYACYAEDVLDVLPDAKALVPIQDVFAAYKRSKKHSDTLLMELKDYYEMTNRRVCVQCGKSGVLRMLRDADVYKLTKWGCGKKLVPYLHYAHSECVDVPHTYQLLATIIFCEKHGGITCVHPKLAVSKCQICFDSAIIITYCDICTPQARCDICIVNNCPKCPKVEKKAPEPSVEEKLETKLKQLTEQHLAHHKTFEAAAAKAYDDRDLAIKDLATVMSERDVLDNARKETVEAARAREAKLQEELEQARMQEAENMDFIDQMQAKLDKAKSANAELCKKLEHRQVSESRILLLVYDGSITADRTSCFPDYVQGGLLPGSDISIVPFDLSKTDKSLAPIHQFAIWAIHSDPGSFPFEVKRKEINFLQLVELLPMPSIDGTLVLVGCASWAVPIVHYQQIADKFRCNILFNDGRKELTVCFKPALSIAASAICGKPLDQLPTELCGKFVRITPTPPIVPAGFSVNEEVDAQSDDLDLEVDAIPVCQHNKNHGPVGGKPGKLYAEHAKSKRGYVRRAKKIVQQLPPLAERKAQLREDHDWQCMHCGHSSKDKPVMENPPRGKCIGHFRLEKPFPKNGFTGDKCVKYLLKIAKQSPKKSVATRKTKPPTLFEPCGPPFGPFNILQQFYMNTPVTLASVLSSSTTADDLKATKFQHTLFGQFSVAENIQHRWKQMHELLLEGKVTVSMRENQWYATEWPILQGQDTMNNPELRDRLIGQMVLSFISGNGKPNPLMHSEWKLRRERVPDDDPRVSLRDHSRVVTVVPTKHREFITLYVGRLEFSRPAQKICRNAREQAQYKSYCYAPQTVIDSRAVNISAVHAHGNISKFFNDYRLTFGSYKPQTLEEKARLNCGGTEFKVNGIPFVLICGLRAIACEEENTLDYDGPEVSEHDAKFTAPATPMTADVKQQWKKLVVASTRSAILYYFAAPDTKRHLDFIFLTTFVEWLGLDISLTHETISNRKLVIHRVIKSDPIFPTICNLFDNGDAYDVFTLLPIRTCLSLLSDANEEAKKLRGAIRKTQKTLPKEPEQRKPITTTPRYPCRYGCKNAISNMKIACIGGCGQSYHEVCMKFSDAKKCSKCQNSAKESDASKKAKSSKDEKEAEQETIEDNIDYSS